MDATCCGGSRRLRNPRNPGVLHESLRWRRLSSTTFLHSALFVFRQPSMARVHDELHGAR